MSELLMLQGIRHSLLLCEKTWGYLFQKVSEDNKIAI